MKIKTFLYIQPVYKNPYSFSESGRIKKIVFSAENLKGKINGQNVEFNQKMFGQHIIEFDDDNVVLDLTISSPISQITGYVIVYKKYEEKYQKSNLTDDLEGI